jgi:hypothetical protein
MKMSISKGFNPANFVLDGVDVKDLKVGILGNCFRVRRPGLEVTVYKPVARAGKEHKVLKNRKREKRHSHMHEG